VIKRSRSAPRADDDAFSSPNAVFKIGEGNGGRGGGEEEDTWRGAAARARVRACVRGSDE